MTDQVNSLRDLDVRVHREVMGLECEQDGDGLWLEVGDGQNVWPIPAYTLDISAAWKAVDHLKQQGCDWTIENWHLSSTKLDNHWTALITLPCGHDTGQLLADTVTEAICLAALKAVAHNELLNRSS